MQGTQAIWPTQQSKSEEPIYYQVPHEMWNIAGAPEN